MEHKAEAVVSVFVTASSAGLCWLAVLMMVPNLPLLLIPTLEALALVALAMFKRS
jgi:hypothetical protein